MYIAKATIAMQRMMSTVEKKMLKYLLVQLMEHWLEKLLKCLLVKL